MIIIVLYFLLIVIFACFKKVNAFDAFSRGIESNFKTVKNIFPTIFALIVSINVFVNSGIIDIVKSFFPNSIFTPELFIQAFLRPISINAPKSTTFLTVPSNCIPTFKLSIVKISLLRSG